VPLKIENGTPKTTKDRGCKNLSKSKKSTYVTEKMIDLRKKQTLLKKFFMQNRL
jgi:hypothetical protein